MGKNSKLTTKEQKEAMLIALEANDSNIKLAAKEAGISIRTHYRWCKEDNDYDNNAGSIKDICFRNAKEHLLRMAMKKIDQGDSAVLNKMLGLFLKDLPEEMKRLNRYNNVPLRAVLKVAPHPRDMYSDDPMTQLAVKQWEEDQEKEKQVRAGKLI